MPHTSLVFRRREDEKKGVFKGGAAASTNVTDAADAADAAAADAADAAASDSSSCGAVEGAIPFRTCADAKEVEYSVMQGLQQQ